MRPFGLLLGIAIGFSAPASAQFYSSPMKAPRPSTPSIVGSASPAIGRDIGAVRKDIDEGVRYGQLSHKQAKELRREAAEIDELESRYAFGGLSDSEAAELRNRIEVLRSITDAKRSGTVN